ncbi:hypothetical protein PR048_007792 [Dryococelus australis]|uniref:Uncharacterized protein n=1 Tax=Dryococelus australis TaxID=614101 RepID=A0ABQ9HVG1_9NEOP|nr:hypothetical protein PR048_007792 [Dryococelus australis]
MVGEVVEGRRGVRGIDVEGDAMLRTTLTSIGGRVNYLSRGDNINIPPRSHVATRARERRNCGCIHPRVFCGLSWQQAMLDSPLYTRDIICILVAVIKCWRPGTFLVTPPATTSRREVNSDCRCWRPGTFLVTPPATTSRREVNSDCRCWRPGTFLVTPPATTSRREVNSDCRCWRPGTFLVTPPATTSRREVNSDCRCWRPGTFLVTPPATTSREKVLATRYVPCNTASYDFARAIYFLSLLSVASSPDQTVKRLLLTLLIWSLAPQHIHFSSEFPPPPNPLLLAHSHPLSQPLSLGFLLLLKHELVLGKLNSSALASWLRRVDGDRGVMENGGEGIEVQGGKCARDTSSSTRGERRRGKKDGVEKEKAKKKDAVKKEVTKKCKGCANGEVITTLPGKQWMLSGIFAFSPAVWPSIRVHPWKRLEEGFGKGAISLGAPGYRYAEGLKFDQPIFLPKSKIKVQIIRCHFGTTLDEQLGCSPPTKANRVRSPAGSLQIFASRYRAGRSRWSTGFLGSAPFPLQFTPS